MKTGIFGCGAAGSQIALAIAQPDMQFILIDDDIVEDNNVDTGTSAYYRYHIGTLKAVVLAEMLYRKCGAIAIPYTKTLTQDRLRDIADAELIIDCFDNSEARRLLHGLDVPTVHVGVSANNTGAITWDEIYQVPEGTGRHDENVPCTHQLGRNIIRFTAAVASSTIEHFLVTGERLNYITTGDLRIVRL